MWRFFSAVSGVSLGVAVDGFIFGWPTRTIVALMIGSVVSSWLGMGIYVEEKLR